ncbi:MAG: response regulator transcription factor [Bryobacterales bacterium]|nr:response regulator transcription factor [Bryobacterales bacterium]
MGRSQIKEPRSPPFEARPRVQFTSATIFAVQQRSVQDAVIRTVLVDDEPIARRILEEELAEIPDVAIVGQADNGRSAIDLIHSQRPDLVLLDIQMPGCDGFAVLSRLSPLPPAVIFVTAFDQHALRAFDAGAADYLLKPVRQHRLRAAIAKARVAIRQPANTAEAIARTLDISGPGGRRRIVGRKGGEYFLLELDDVLAFRAEGEIVWIITKQKRYLANCSLQELANRLRGQSFRRIHRSALINVNHIRKMSTLSSQRWLVTLSNDLELVVSKRQAHTIREVLQA